MFMITTQYYVEFIVSILASSRPKYSISIELRDIKVHILVAAKVNEHTAGNHNRSCYLRPETNRHIQKKDLPLINILLLLSTLFFPLQQNLESFFHGIKRIDRAPDERETSKVPNGLSKLSFKIQLADVFYDFLTNRLRLSKGRDCQRWVLFCWVLTKRSYFENFLSTQMNFHSTEKLLMSNSNRRPFEVIFFSKLCYQFLWKQRSGGSEVKRFFIF